MLTRAELLAGLEDLLTTVPIDASCDHFSAGQPGRHHFNGIALLEAIHQRSLIPLGVNVVEAVTYWLKALPPCPVLEDPPSPTGD